MWALQKFRDPGSKGIGWPGEPGMNGGEVGESGGSQASGAGVSSAWAVMSAGFSLRLPLPVADEMVVVSADRKDSPACVLAKPVKSATCLASSK